MKVNLDKELDQYFKSSFEDFEQEPSSEAWEHIEKELDKKTTKKPFVFWNAAASILLIMAVGLGLYFNNSNEIKLKDEKPELIVASETPSIALDKKAEIGDLRIEKNVAIEKQVLAKVNLLSEQKSLSTYNNEIEKSVPNESESQKIAALEEGSFGNIEPIKAISEEWSKEAMQKTMANTEIKLAMLETIDNDQKEIKENNKNRKIGISSFGDLVNLVVAQIDKREEKIITVSKTEEGENEITGINLGLFKFNKTER